MFRVNGHDIKRLAEVGELTPDGRPVVVLCDTDAARGLEVLKSRAPKMHYVRFTSEEEKDRYMAAYAELCGEEAVYPQVRKPEAESTAQPVPRS